MAKLYLQLATGEVFEGESAGSVRDVIGELVFTTGVVGYLETITDPAYRGQIVVQTYPLAGNYGIIPEDAISGEPQVRALIVREICDMPANYRCAGTMAEYLRKNKVVCMTGIDTRTLTSIIRAKGTVNARITAKKPDAPDADLLGYRVEGEMSAADSRTVGIHPSRGGTAHRVAVLDCGDRLRIVVAPKGAGSENMSKIKMLKPADGRQGVIDFVLEAVRAAGPNPCPPIVVGVGVGGNFDHCAKLAKKALTRSIGVSNSDPFYAEMEAQLLEEINRFGTGPAGFGGATTALAVHIEQMATHIACLPVAVNINCHVARHESVVL
jgi:hypothetical protein